MLTHNESHNKIADVLDWNISPEEFDSSCLFFIFDLFIHNGPELVFADGASSIPDL